MAKKTKKQQFISRRIRNILLIISLPGIVIYIYFFNPKGKYILNSSNTQSVVSDQYHRVGTPNGWTYKSGEWTPNTHETYASLIKFNIPELMGIKKGMLHLNIETFNNKTIPNERCPESKKFSIKKVISPWDPETAGFNEIESRQKTGEVVSYFTVKPNDQFVEVEIPVRELMEAHGFTIDQADEVLCRVSFYSQLDKNGETRQPYILVNKVF